MFNKAYENAASALAQHGDTNYCAPVALALVTGRNVKETNTDLQRRKLRTYGCGMSTTNMHRYLWDTNVEFAQVAAFNFAGRTMTTINRLYPKGTYLVFVSGHVAAMIDGEIMDWTAGRRHRVVDLLRITKIEGKDVDQEIEPKVAPRTKIKLYTPRSKESKSRKMLFLLDKFDGACSINTLAKLLNTSENSIRCYVSYFRNGSRGHQKIAMKIVRGEVIRL